VDHRLHQEDQVVEALEEVLHLFQMVVLIILEEMEQQTLVAVEVDLLIIYHRVLAQVDLV
tara:strand:- start:30 stop:209 length:180 start_codon:yes stop_codon:yes gene_type:complete